MYHKIRKGKIETIERNGMKSILRLCWITYCLNYLSSQEKYGASNVKRKQFLMSK